jgi:hypothetical protein
LGTNPKEAFYALSVVLFARTGRTVRICTTANFGTKIEAREGTIFKAAFAKFSEEGRSYKRQGTAACFGHIFRGAIFSKSVQLYELWHGFQDNFVVGQFCVVSCLSWLEIVL